MARGTYSPDKPGPWKVARDLFPGPRPFTVYRDAGTHYEWMTDKRGNEKRFSTEAQALSAISRAAR